MIDGLHVACMFNCIALQNLFSQRLIMIYVVLPLQDASVTTVAQEVPYLDMVIDETLRLYPPSPKYVMMCIKMRVSVP